MNAIPGLANVLPASLLIKRLTMASALWILLPTIGTAHHSVNAFFDLANPIEIEGTLTSIRWNNPHVRLTLERLGEDGATESWTVDSGGPTLLRRLGVTAESAQVGEQVTVSGFQAKRNPQGMLGASIELADGRVMPLFPSLARRFGHEATTGVHITQEAATEGARTARGIFRVWTYGRTNDRPVAQPVLTAAALAGQEDYDPLVDDPALLCIAQGMPLVMDNPFPVEFTERGEEILLQLEIWDIVRTIHMVSDPGPGNPPATPLGYSVGHWEGDTLVVSTNRMNWPYFDSEGTPQSHAIELLERFTLSEDETRLDYDSVATDPETLVEPMTLSWHWNWVPGEDIQAYDCTLSE